MDFTDKRNSLTVVANQARQIILRRQTFHLINNCEAEPELISYHLHIIHVACCLSQIGPHSLSR